ncbi:Hint domain-containing protein [Lentibacter sp. XHP0401]|uniref:Hint domain-containing protein n=1 Tax=Lentibacter sp. XHP0401 TaxID=2984334 RepID=UPI0021E91114|nr:Hint domain-containing protein [Lentibacter sp. XHP0401]MCV2893751.1 Hint domain-containing protein [Lentibacter sp. XHP0401]
MPITFYAIDEEFAAGTGSNVYVTPDSTRFDNPPGAFMDLVITSNEGDDDPRVFELGDTYDLSWGGFGGGGTIDNAVVVRSDVAPDGGDGGVIVFEGLDENGELTHIIWTPGFNLEQWYSDNYNPSMEPNFWVTDSSPTYDHKFVCFEAGTRIATRMGEIPVDEIWAGDKLLTLDHGEQPVLWTGSKVVRGYGRNAPVLFSPGAIGNHAPLRLSQQHRVLVASAAAQLLFGADEVFVPAKALVNGGDIRLAPCVEVQYYHLLLAEHGIVTADGAYCETLLMGEQAGALVTPPPHLAGCSCKAARPVLSYAEALTLFGKMRPVRAASPLVAL